MIDKDYFLDLLKKQNVSQRKLAEMMGITHSQLSLTFKGARRMALNEAISIAQIFGVPLQEVADHSGAASVVPRRKHTIKMIMDERGIAHSNDRHELVNAPQGIPAESLLVQARTAESGLAWMDGWIFICQPVGKTPSSDLLDVFCLARLSATDGGRLVVGRLRKGYQPGQFALSGPHNTSSATIQEVFPALLIKP